MQLTPEQKRQKVWLEIKDLLLGAAFPLMMQIVFSVSVILFADYTAELAIRIIALVIGEVLLIGAYVIFGRQNGIAAVRRGVQSQKKRNANSDDIKAYYKTGEYALYKGFLIALISTVPFILFQFIVCVAPNSVCAFMVKYAFGWAVYPFVLIGEACGGLSEWVNFVAIIFPVGIHAAAYYWGALKERKNQQKVAEAQEIKAKRRK
ncbi:MAG: hypothetical protein K2G96_01700 [Clostridia bacterium]|nr:hypothetical protein [Clostridia bacterium]